MESDRGFNTNLVWMTNYGIVYLHEYEDYALFFMTQFFNTI